jgi:hypothetical protein
MNRAFAARIDCVCESRIDMQTARQRQPEGARRSFEKLSGGQVIDRGRGDLCMGRVRGRGPTLIGRRRSRARDEPSHGRRSGHAHHSTTDAHESITVGDVGVGKAIDTDVPPVTPEPPTLATSEKPPAATLESEL